MVCKLKKYFLKVSLLSIFFVFWGALFNFKALNLPEHTNLFYINDFANILNEETKNYIFNQSKILEEKTSAQIVVATVSSLEEASIEEYSLNLFRKWGIGNKEKNNGLLILLAPNERKVRIEIGYGLEGKINDSKAGRLRDQYAVPSFRNNEWDKGIQNLYSALLAEVYSEYNMEIPKEISSAVDEHSEYIADDTNLVMDIAVVVIIFLIIIVSLFIFRRKKGDHYNDHDNYYGGFGGFGGDFGGGSSFGGFSGGGGSCGGGGASGSF